MLWLRMAGDAGHLPPLIAAWLPNFIVAAAAALGLVRCR
jgi:lipopolysaccharide export LptBFGC system permease protein LptF